MDLSTVIGIFNLLVGLMLTASILLMVGGLILWSVRLGIMPSYRDEAIKLMQWAVAILFVLVFLLYIAQFVQTHRALTMMLIGTAIVAIIAYFVANVMLAGGDKKEEH